MIVEFKVTLDEMHTLVDMMMAEHEEYYGTPSNADRAFANGLGFYETNAGFGWRSSQGNDLHLHQDLGGWTAIYRGRRHWPPSRRVLEKVPSRSSKRSKGGETGGTPPPPRKAGFPLKSRRTQGKKTTNDRHPLTSGPMGHSLHLLLHLSRCTGCRLINPGTWMCPPLGETNVQFQNPNSY